MFKIGQKVKINPKILNIPSHLSHILPPERYERFVPKTFRLNSVQSMYIDDLSIYKLIQTHPNYEWFRINFPQLIDAKGCINVWNVTELGEKMYDHVFVEWILIPIDDISIY